MFIDLRFLITPLDSRYNYSMATLFKIHEDADCEKLLYLVRYLSAREKIDIRPKYIVERNFPDLIDGVVPSLIVDQVLYQGLDSIVEYYEEKLGLKNLLYKSEAFRKRYADYRVSDDSTHRLIE